MRLRWRIIKWLARDDLIIINANIYLNKERKHKTIVYLNEGDTAFFNNTGFYSNANSNHMIERRRI